MCICYIGKQGAAMESKIYRIQNLKCSDKRNRIKLVKAVMKIIKADKKPSIELLEKWQRSLQKKYKININVFEISKCDMQVSMEIEQNVYTSFVCNTYYESLCKYILMVKEHVKYREEVGKYK